MFWTLNTRHLGCDVTVVLEEIKVSPLLLLVIMGSALLLVLGALENEWLARCSRLIEARLGRHPYQGVGPIISMMQ